MGYWKARDAHEFLEHLREDPPDEVVWARVRDMIWAVAFRDRQGLGEGLFQDGQFETFRDALERDGIPLRRTGRDGAYSHVPTLDGDGNVVATVEGADPDPGDRRGPVT